MRSSPGPCVAGKRHISEVFLGSGKPAQSSLRKKIVPIIQFWLQGAARLVRFTSYLMKWFKIKFVSTQVKITTSGTGQGNRLLRPLALWLFLASLISVIFAIMFTLEHFGPPNAWERVDAELQTRGIVVEKRGVGMQRFPAWFLQESYLAEWQGHQIVCAWQVTVIPGFRDIAYSMAKAQDGFRPLGSKSMVGLDPDNRGLCRPLDGWSTLAEYQVAALFGFCGIMAFFGINLWRRSAAKS